MKLHEFLLHLFDRSSLKVYIYFLFLNNGLNINVIVKGLVAELISPHAQSADLKKK